MTTTDANRETLRQAAAAAQYAARNRTIREEVSQAWARVAELRAAGLGVEADFVESQIEGLERE